MNVIDRAGIARTVSEMMVWGSTQGSASLSSDGCHIGWMPRAGLAQPLTPGSPDSGMLTVTRVPRSDSLWIISCPCI